NLERVMRSPKRRYQRSNWRTSRREFLSAATFAAAAGALSSMLRAEAAAGIQGSSKAIINLHLDGGPPHLDMFDLKPEAPVEIRGAFQPIATRVAGFQVCELLPRLAS